MFVLTHCTPGQYLPTYGVGRCYTEHILCRYLYVHMYYVCTWQKGTLLPLPNRLLLNISIHSTYYIVYTSAPFRPLGLPLQDSAWRAQPRCRSRRCLLSFTTRMYYVDILWYIRSILDWTLHCAPCVAPKFKLETSPCMTEEERFST